MWGRKIRVAVMIGLQSAGALGLFAGLAFAPPAQGRMLLLPVTPGGAAQAARIALAHDVRLLGPGPVAGSLVISGESRALVGPLLRAGVIALAAPPALCGNLSLDGGKA